MGVWVALREIVDVQDMSSRKIPLPASHICTVYTNIREICEFQTCPVLIGIVLSSVCHC